MAKQGVGKLSVCASLLAGCMALLGCGDFFVCQKSSCTTSGSGTSTNTGDYAYVSNSTSGATYLAEYNIGSGALTAISGSPFSLGYVPVSLKVSPNNSFLYAGSAAGAIYLYTIGSTGALTASSSNPVATTLSGSLSSLDISPDGGFLYAMDTTGLFLFQYSLNTSTGAISGYTSFGVPGTAGCTLTGTPVSQGCTVKVSPGGSYVAVALGSAGTVVYPYAGSGGISSGSYTALIPCCSAVASPSGDFSLAFDNNNYLYIGRTLALSSYGNVGTSTPVNETNSTYASGQTPRAVTLSTNYNYVYTANEGAGTVSGFGLSGAAVLTALSGSPFAGPTNVSTLGADNTGSYLVAVGYNASSGVQLFKPSSGVLGSAVASAGTGTNTSYPALVALTH